MASGSTTRGIRRGLEQRFQGAAAPSGYFVALVTDAVAPTVDTILFSELTEVPAGNGYTSGGIALSLNTTDFPTLTENTTLNKAILTLKDIVWTASGGDLPASGNGARYAVLLGPNATVGSREVYYFFDLTSNRKVSVGQTLTLDDFILEGRAVSE